MRKFTKEISALIATAAIGTAAGIGAFSASSEEIVTTAGVDMNPDATICATELPPLGGAPLPPDELIEPTTEEELPPVEGLLVPEPTTLPPLMGDIAPTEWIEPTTEEEIPPMMGDIAPPDGDINGDGSLSIADVVLFQKWLLNQPSLEINDLTAADLYMDGKLDVFDLCLMKKALIEKMNDTPVSPISAPLSQPIALNNMEEVKDLLNNYDLTAYPEEAHDNYRKMFDRFKEDGYIYYFSENENAKSRIQLDDHPNAKIWLNPFAKYEDTGILYHVTYKGNAYQVYFYFTDPAYSGQYQGMSEYIDKRFGFNKFNNIKEIAQKFAVMTVNYENGTQLCAYSIIDNAHYYAVRTTASEDELMDFLNVLEYKKVNF